MLLLKNITKDYIVGPAKVEALRGLSLAFRTSEFVSVLGPSGCGKTTLLNLLGGLDRYTAGDIIIGGKSTKDFTERDWDTYRNRRIGFVFQNYNLIPHQSVLSNVELALTLSGVSRSERRSRAVSVLERVGLGDQLSKKPTQMSGGQMQRVAIARALVNNPDILMADEPTGALDSENSVQVMEILKEIAKDRLVILVTHNSDLAERYSTRTIKLLDGKITDDSDPYDPGDAKTAKAAKSERRAKTSMSFLTALSLSTNNLLTKKTRTFMTAFAGSIGIIGIALILALSSGFQRYIDRMQEDTLSTYPLTIEQTTTDLTSMLNAMSAVRQREEHPLDKVYSGNIMTKMVETMLKQIDTNDLASFKVYLDDHETALRPWVNDIKYSYNLHLNIFAADYEDEITRVNPFRLFESSGMGNGVDYSSMSGMGMTGGGVEIWSEMLDNEQLLTAQFELLAGEWPDEWNEVVLVVDEHNEITDFSMYALGLKDASEIDEMFKAFVTPGTEYTAPGVTVLTYDEVLAITYLYVPETSLYKRAGEGWLDMRDDDAYMRELLASEAEVIRVTGILRPAEDVEMTSIGSTVGYLKLLTEHLVEVAAEADIVRAQLAAPDTDVFTGKPFAAEGEAEPPFDISSLPPEQQAWLATLSEEERAELIRSFSPTSSATYEGNMAKFGALSLDDPSSIAIYPVDFASKESITEFISDYNKSVTDSGHEELVIHYTDFIGLLLSSVSSIINAISYVLIAFVGISLVVSSIMIGIITYVSVLERTKEIGILKAIGASAKDISRVFNAETLIVGFTAGALGILVTLLLCIPANAIIKNLTDVGGIAALPLLGGVVLVALSMGLTLLAGLIPSRIAARKDPVEALRSE
ncbi:MAG: ABC transporter ATP-binding protein/permease [Oscillospiraceae bacterium]|jgi:putative ABC transport system permease protein|nr:ABC transporter ATP-binding protein/permease [Oscillospiraceae bacterium]